MVTRARETSSPRRGKIFSNCRLVTPRLRSISTQGKICAGTATLPNEGRNKSKRLRRARTVLKNQPCGESCAGHGRAREPRQVADRDEAGVRGVRRDKAALFPGCNSPQLPRRNQG